MDPRVDRGVRAKAECVDADHTKSIITGEWCRTWGILYT